MGIDDKFKEAVGKAKEGIGDALDNEELRRDGQQDRLAANAEQVGDKIHEKTGDVVGDLADKSEHLTDRLTGDDHR